MVETTEQQQSKVETIRAGRDAEETSATEERYVTSLHTKTILLQMLTYTTTTTTTEKIDWNRSPKTISSEWIWSPPVSPQKEKEEEEIEELKLPAVSPSNSNKADVKSLTKEMGSSKSIMVMIRRRRRRMLSSRRRRTSPRPKRRKRPQSQTIRRRKRRRRTRRRRRRSFVQMHRVQIEIISSRVYTGDIVRDHKCL